MALTTHALPPHRCAQHYRASFLAAVSDADLRAITQQLVDQAKAGNLTAIRYLLDRVLGQTGVDAWPSEGALRLQDAIEGVE